MAIGGTIARVFVPGIMRGVFQSSGGGGGRQLGSPECACAEQEVEYEDEGKHEAEEAAAEEEAEEEEMLEATGVA